MEHEQRKEQILRYVCRDGEGNADLYGSQRWSIWRKSWKN